MARISTRHLASTCQRLGTSLRAGADIIKVLNQEAGRGSSTYQRNMQEVADRVSNGATMADGMRQCGGYFPELACELVDVGEQTGQLESVLLRLADHYEHLRRLRRTFLAGISWPVFELVVGIVAIGLLIFILGAIDSSSAGVFGLAGPRGLLIYGGIILLAVATITLLVLGIQRGWFGKWPDELLIRLPVVGKSIQTMALSRLAWTLSFALNAGIDAQRAIRLALGSTQSSYFTRHQDQVAVVIERGGQFHEALRQTGAFPREFLDSLETAEVSGTETESLTRLSREYQERAETSTKLLAVAAGMLIWIGIAALFIFVIFDLFFSLYLAPIKEAAEWANNPR